MILSEALSTPMSMTVKPEAPSMVETSDLPISWMSPSTVAMTTLPRVLRSEPRLASSGSRVSNGGFHGLACHDEFGQEGIACREGLAHGVDADDESVGDGSQRVHPFGNGLLGQLGRESESPSMMDWAICFKSSSDMVAPWVV